MIIDKGIGQWKSCQRCEYRQVKGDEGRQEVELPFHFFFFVDEYLVVACRHLFSVCSAFHCCASDCCDQLVWLRYGSRTGPELDDLLVHFSDEMFLCHITLDE